jgi:DNA-binding response OmpR family regulator
MDTLPLDREVIVLLAADEPEVRAMLEKLLKQGGYELIVAADGLDAFHKADDYKGRIDLLVASLQMPGMTGTDLAKEMRRARPELRVMLMSSYPQGLLVLDTGWHFIQKPYLPKVLLEKLIQVLKKPPSPYTDRGEG